MREPYERSAGDEPDAVKTVKNRGVVPVRSPGMCELGEPVVWWRHIPMAATTEWTGAGPDSCRFECSATLNFWWWLGCQYTLGWPLFKFLSRSVAPRIFFFWWSLIRWFQISYRFLKIREKFGVAGRLKVNFDSSRHTVRRSVSYVIKSSDKSKVLLIRFILVHKPSFSFDQF